MDIRDAVELITDAIPSDTAGVWADLGAGEGTFSHALVELLGPGSRVYAVDRERNALASLDRSSDPARRNIIPVVADFSRPFELPNRNGALLDGLLFANALHFIRDPDATVARLAQWLKPGGRVVFVEYDRRGPNRWVPHPISADELPAIASAAGLSAPKIVARRPSIYSGDLYVAVADRVTSSSLL